MKAAIVDQGQPPAYGDYPDPVTDGDLTIVPLRAAALTNLDITIASGRHYFSPADYLVILGKECVATTNGVDVVIDYLNGQVVAEAALDVMAEGGRTVQVGSAAGPATTLSAQVMRRGGLDVLGFAYYHAPLAGQAAAYAVLCRHALAGALTINTTMMPLHAVAEAWVRQKTGSKTRLVLVAD